MDRYQHMTAAGLTAYADDARNLVVAVPPSYYSDSRFRTAITPQSAARAYAAAGGLAAARQVAPARSCDGCVVCWILLGAAGGAVAVLAAALAVFS